MPIDAPNYQWATGVSYIVGDRGTMAVGVKDVSPFVADTLTGSENFETDPISGSGTWTLTGTTPRSGLRCLRSAVIGNSSTTDYTFTVPVGTNFIKFWHRVSSELNFDIFQVYKNVVGVPANLLFSLSGTANIWQQQQITITGVTSIIFRYLKDSSSAVGLDAAFIDDIEWISTLGAAAVQQYEPLHLDPNNRLKVSLLGETIAITGLQNTPKLNCATDSVEICNDAGSPISVMGTVALDAGTLAALETINIGNIPHVVVDNFPAHVFSDCATDSVTICPGDDPIVVVVDNFPTSTPLDCATDSVTVCPGDDPLEVIVNNFPIVTPLDCATDSVTICPGDDPIVVDVLGTVSVTGTVNVGNFPAVAHLNCATDSVEICNDAGSPITVSVLGTVAVTGMPHLNCATDSVTACIDEPLDVNVINTITLVPGKRDLLGLYYATSPAIVYTTAADGATGGDIWVVNTSNTVVVSLRSVRFTALLDSLALLTNLPAIRMERMTFTGTPSGAQITPAKRDSTDPTNTATVRTASTGMTITAGAAIETFTPPTADVIGGLLAVNATASIPVEQLFVSDIDSAIVLRQNEGIVFRQNTAGNATENRQYWVNIVWEEV